MKKLYTMAVIGLLALQGSAFAETFKANVVSIDPVQNRLTVSPIEKTDKLPASIDLAVKEDAKFKGGAATLADVNPGDEVKVNAKEEENGAWLAKSVEVTAASAGTAAAQANTMDVSQANATATDASATDATIAGTVTTDTTATDAAASPEANATGATTVAQ